jgi:hypothetical protein
MSLPTPTFSPTSQPRPTVRPSAAPKPTIAPIQANGWLFINQYSEESCTGDITNVNGMPTNKCFIEYDTTNTPIGSHRFACAGDFIEVNYYSSTDCSARYLTESNRFFYGCAYRVQDYYYSEHPYSMALTCQVGNSMIPSDPNFSGKYAIQK